MKIDLTLEHTEAEDLVDVFDKFAPVVLCYLQASSTADVSVVYGNGDNYEEFYDQTLFGTVEYDSECSDVTTEGFVFGWVGFGRLKGTGIRVVATQNASAFGCFYILTDNVASIPTVGEVDDDEVEEELPPTLPDALTAANHVATLHGKKIDVVMFGQVKTIGRTTIVPLSCVDWPEVESVDVLNHEDKFIVVFKGRHGSIELCGEQKK